MAIYSVVIAPFLVVESDWVSTNIRAHAFLALLAKPKHRLDKIHATNQICHGTDREGVSKTVTKATKRTSAFANQPRNRPAPKLEPVQTTVCLASATRIPTANRTRTGDYLTKLPLKSLISIHTSPKGGDCKSEHRSPHSGRHVHFQPKSYLRKPLPEDARHTNLKAEPEIWKHC